MGEVWRVGWKVEKFAVDVREMPYADGFRIFECEISLRVHCRSILTHTPIELTTFDHSWVGVQEGSGWSAKTAKRVLQDEA